MFLFFTALALISLALPGQPVATSLPGCGRDVVLGVDGHSGAIVIAREGSDVAPAPGKAYLVKGSHSLLEWGGEVALPHGPPLGSVSTTNDVLAATREGNRSIRTWRLGGQRWESLGGIQLPVEPGGVEFAEDLAGAHWAVVRSDPASGRSFFFCRERHKKWRVVARIERQEFGKPMSDARNRTSILWGSISIREDGHIETVSTPPAGTDAHELIFRRVGDALVAMDALLGSASYRADGNSAWRRLTWGPWSESGDRAPGDGRLEIADWREPSRLVLRWLHSDWDVEYGEVTRDGDWRSIARVIQKPENAWQLPGALVPIGARFVALSACVRTSGGVDDRLGVHVFSEGSAPSYQEIEVGRR